MTDPYEQYADIFMASMAGEMSGLKKEQFIALCKTKWPTQTEFLVMMASLENQAQMQIEQAQARLKPGQTLAVAYPIEAPPEALHRP